MENQALVVKTTEETQENKLGLQATQATYEGKPLYKGGEAVFNHDHKVDMNGEKSIIVKIGKVTTQIVLNAGTNLADIARRILTQHLADFMKWKVLDGLPVVKTKAMAVGLNNIKGLNLPKPNIQWASSMDFESAKKDFLTDENLHKVENQIKQLFTIKALPTATGGATSETVTAE